MKIDLVYPEVETQTGIHRYANTLVKYIKEETDISVEKIPIKKKEWTLMNKPVGGYLSLWVSKMFKRFGGDVVHSLDPVVSPIKADVLTIHDLIPYKYPEIYGSGRSSQMGYKINKWFAKKSDKYMVQTDHVKNDLVNLWNFDEDDIFVTGFGVRHDLFYPSDDVPDCMKTEKDVLLYVGDNNPRKGLNIILKSMTYLDDVRLVKVGTNKWDGVYKDSERIIKENNLDVCWAGYVDDLELKDYYTHADLYVYPSLDEGTGYTPLEAMACGTQALVSDIDVFHETIGDIAKFSSREPEQLARDIKRSIYSFSDPIELSEYAKKYKWEDVAKKTVEFYDEIYKEK